jgi:tripartite-type tricarboxylate transporter receptor subunit TctC
MIGRLLALMLISGVPLHAAQPSLAQFPTRPIEITVPFGVGNAADVTARHLAKGMTEHLGVPVAVANRPGAGGAIAFTHVSMQPSDGYSVGYITTTICTAYYSGNLSFDHTAFAPVARVTIETPVLVVRADAPWRTVNAIVDDAKKNPGKFRIGNSGTGTHTHLSASTLFQRAGAAVIHVPFGGGQATANLLAGRIEAVVQLPPALIAYVKSGDLRVLAALGAKRDRIFPEAPTATEAGFPVSLDLWRGIVVPKNAPLSAIEKLEEAIRLTVVSQEFLDAGEKIGFQAAFLPSKEFSQLIIDDDRKLASVMDALGLKKR